MAHWRRRFAYDALHINIPIWANTGIIFCRQVTDIWLYHQSRTQVLDVHQNETKYCLNRNEQFRNLAERSQIGSGATRTNETVDQNVEKLWHCRKLSAKTVLNCRTILHCRWLRFHSTVATYDGKIKKLSNDNTGKVLPKFGMHCWHQKILCTRRSFVGGYFSRRQNSSEHRRKLWFLYSDKSCRIEKMSWTKICPFTRLQVDTKWVWRKQETSFCSSCNINCR